MKIGDRERLVTRVRQMRRLAKAPEAQPGGETPGPDPALVAALQERVGHLEQLLEGLQDSVHRESLRQDRRIADLEAQIQPAALGAALTRDARERGL